MPLATASLNYVGDLGDSIIRETREIKKVITGRDLVHCDRKHKDAIDFFARCAHLWLGNEMPPAFDASGAVQRRLIFLRADREGGDGSVDRTVPSRLPRSGPRSRRGA